MKKAITILIIFLSAHLCISAQTDPASLRVTDLKMVRGEEYVEVLFNLAVGKRATPRRYSLVVTPVLVKGARRAELAPVVVQGIRSKVSVDRQLMSAGKNAPDMTATNALFTRNGKKVAYAARVPYQDWMVGADLVLEGSSVGCCDATESEIGVIAENVLYSTPPRIPQPEMQIIEIQPESLPVTSAGDRLAWNYPFIAPISHYDAARGKAVSGELFDYNMPLNINGKETNRYDVEQYIDDNRETSLTIYFNVASTSVDRGFRDNNKALVELVSAVRAIQASDDSRVVRVVVAGFASPEGSSQRNDRLAWDRAVAVKNFLLNNTSLTGVTVNIHNGSVDWGGLRKLVAESDMYRKYRIMEIIDNTPIWDAQRNVGRHGELMRLDGGEPYRYMQRNFFPELRNAAFIKIYYENTKP